MAVVREHFRPEFLNRLDEIVLFRRLQRADMAAIVEIQLAAAARAAGRPQDRAGARPSGARVAGDEGYDSVYGARPLKRVIQRSLQNPLAGLILEGAVKEGETVHVSRRPGRADDQRPAGRSGLSACPLPPLGRGPRCRALLASAFSRCDSDCKRIQAVIALTRRRGRA